jgi:xanthine/uracil permease
MFRIFAALLMMLVAINLSQTLALPGLPPSVNTAVFWLILAGLTTLALTEDPIKVGHGLFTALVGFELFYTTLESSLLLTGLWGAINLLIALAIGYLTVVKGTGLEEER